MKLVLCGSTRFRDAFNDWNIILTLAGHVVYGLGGFTREVKDVDKSAEHFLVSEEQKRRVDLVHLMKISESEAILVLNVNGYIGESTTREIEFARMLRKDVYWLENSKPGELLGVSVWRLYNLFDDQPIVQTPGTKKY